MRLSKLIRRFRYGKPVLIVSGLPRSGTSMLMKMLEAGGLEVATDEIRAADLDNPKGYYELERVKELDKQGADKAWVAGMRGKVLKVVSFLLRDLPGDNSYKVLFVDRDLDEVLASQNRMLAHRDKEDSQVSDEKMKENYANHLRRTKSMLERETRFEVFYLDHRAVIDEGTKQAAAINRFLGGHLDEQKMAQVIDPQLYRNRA